MINVAISHILSYMYLCMLLHYSQLLMYIDRNLVFTTVKVMFILCKLLNHAEIK